MRTNSNTIKDYQDNTMKRLLLFFAMLISLTLPFERLGGSFLRAQGNDPVLAGMILAYTNKAEKELYQAVNDLSEAFATRTIAENYLQVICG